MTLILKPDNNNPEQKQQIPHTYKQRFKTLNKILVSQFIKNRQNLFQKYNGGFVRENSMKIITVLTKYKRKIT